MIQEHGKEPWAFEFGDFVNEGYIVDADGSIIIGSTNNGDIEDDDPHIIRALECVNACVGIVNPEIIPVIIKAAKVVTEAGFHTREDAVHDLCEIFAALKIRDKE